MVKLLIADDESFTREGILDTISMGRLYLSVRYEKPIDGHKCIRNY